MAAGNTVDTRVHVMGDLYMMTGTFTDGGIDVYFGDHLSTVLAAGGNYTSQYNTGITKDGAVAIGDTTFTVQTLDMRIHFNVGETVYNATGGRIGVITAMAADATGMTIGAPGCLVAVGDNDTIHKSGAFNAAITLTDDQLDISIDKINNYLVIGTGNMGAGSVAATSDGNWWILGQR